MAIEPNRNITTQAYAMMMTASKSGSSEADFDFKKFEEALVRPGSGVNDEFRNSLIHLGLHAKKPWVIQTVLKVFPEFAKNEGAMGAAMRRAASNMDMKGFDAIYNGAREVFPQSQAFTAVKVGASLDMFVARGHLDPRERDAEGNTLLHHAARTLSKANFGEVIRTPGIDQNAQNHMGDTAVHAIFDGSHRAPVKNIPDLLSEAGISGCDFTMVNNAGRSPAYAFANSRRFDDPKSADIAAQAASQMRLLGADFSKPSPDGRRPLDGDVAGMNPKVVAMLVERREMPSNPSDWDVFEACLAAGSGEALRELEKNGSKWREDLGADQAAFYGVARARELNDVAPINAMVAAGVSFNVKNEAGDSPISLARDIACSDEVMHALTELKREQVHKDIVAKAQERMAARSGPMKRRQAADLGAR